MIDMDAELLEFWNNPPPMRHCLQSGGGFAYLLQGLAGSVDIIKSNEHHNGFEVMGGRVSPPNFISSPSCHQLFFVVSGFYLLPEKPSHVRRACPGARLFPPGQGVSSTR